MVKIFFVKNESIRKKVLFLQRLLKERTTGYSVARLIAPALGAGGRRFKSYYPDIETDSSLNCRFFCF